MNAELKPPTDDLLRILGMTVQDVFNAGHYLGTAAHVCNEYSDKEHSWQQFLNGFCRNSNTKLAAEQLNTRTPPTTGGKEGE